MGKVVFFILYDRQLSVKDFRPRNLERVGANEHSDWLKIKETEGKSFELEGCSSHRARYGISNLMIFFF